MSELDIYDQPGSTSKASTVKPPGLIRGKLIEYSTKIRHEVNDKKEKCASAEQKVLSTVKPVTRFIPVTYDTVKRISVISLCTLSGVLQGRKSGGFRRILYPMCGFIGGNTACYPKQTYTITTKTLTTTLPLVATAGKATVDGSRFVVHQTKKVSTFIYEKVKEKFPEKSDKNTGTDQPTPSEATQEVVLIDDSVEILEDAVSLEDSPAQVESQTMSGVEEAMQDNELKTEVVEPSEESSDKVIPVEKLSVPTEVPPIEENLGMGDREHDDMYSTRSSRS